MEVSEQYHIRPRAGAKFSKVEVERVIKSVLQARFGDLPYVWEDCPQLAKEATAEIQQRVDALGYRRYKLIAQVTIAEAANQGMRIGSRCLWDPEVDNYAEVTLSTPAMHVNALVFGLYWE